MSYLNHGKSVIQIMLTFSFVAFVPVLISCTSSSSSSGSSSGSQTTYLAYATYSTEITSITATATNGSACLASPSSLTNVAVGQWVAAANYSFYGNYPQVTGLPGTCSAGQIQISFNASISQSDTFTFFSSQINAYTLDPVGKTVTSSTGTALTLPAPPTYLLLSSNSKFIYSVSASSDNISVYNISSTGGLTYNSAASLTLPAITFLANAKLFTINGNDYIYIADYNDNQIYAYQVNSANGVLTEVSDLAGLNRSSSCDKICAKKGPDHGKKEIYT